jgi:hypothetical protein
MKDHNLHYITMFFIMILSGALSTMNVWADKYDDIRFSINDAYMILLMTGWMFLFMGIVYRERNVFMIGIILVITNLWFIRNQTWVTENQYTLGMIPHHSMAVHMSKQLLRKNIPFNNNNNNNNNNIRSFVENIINTQQKEILYMKDNSK